MYNIDTQLKINRSRHNVDVISLQKTQLKLETSVQCKMTTNQIDYGPDACKFPKFVRMIKSRRINTKKRAENGKQQRC